MINWRNGVLPAVMFGFLYRNSNKKIKNQNQSNREMTFRAALTPHGAQT